LAERLYRLFPHRSDVLGALAEFLNADADFAYLSHESRAGKDSYLVVTPRLRVRFFPDRNNGSTVILTAADPNQPDRWAIDKKKGDLCRLTWTTAPVPVSAARDEVLDAVRTASDAHIRSTPFWEFWSELLNKEQAKIDELKSFPGWAYSRRRVGLEGEIEFETEDAEATSARCSGSFLVSQVPSDKDGERGGRLVSFQVTGGKTEGWLSGTARGKTDLGDIPKQGVIRLDWISPAAELKRRRTTLDRLLKGQAALPGLRDMLPKGPSQTCEIVAFVAQLDKAYNEDQKDAIGKALAENTVTCILGPPGTGKTSVIAELAMQMTKQGKRVLISSQTNLAVDNALERLVNQPGIFPVRLGRLEALKLSPELHIDAASKRYKAKLLSQSETAEAKLLAQADGSIKLPAEQELDGWIEGWKALRRLQVEAQTLKSELDLNESKHQSANTIKRAAQAKSDAACSWAGLDPLKVESFLRVVDDLTMNSVDIEAISKERLNIKKVLARKSAFAALISKAEQVAALNTSAQSTDREITRHTERLGKPSLRLADVEEAKRFNEALARKRTKSGFWASIWSEITESPKDLIPLEEELAKATRLEREAEAALPSLRTRLVKERSEHEALVTNWNASYRDLFGLSSAASISSASIEIKRLLKLGEAVERARGLDFLDALQEFRQVREANFAVEQAATKAGKAELAFRDSASRLADASELLKTLPDRSPDIRKTMNLFGLSDEALSKEAFGPLRDRLKERHRLLSSIPPIQDALRLYRERLGQPAVDLQRAVIAEADVVGATCSGIAGAKDFEADFDCVIVDEAGRTNPLELVMAVVRGKSIVLVGDHKQLPPFVSDSVRSEVSESDREYLDSSIFETIYNSSEEFGRTATLHKQYRMSPPICEIVTQLSYQDTPLVTDGPALELNLGVPGMRPVHWVRPLGGRNRATPKGTGLVNEAETEAAVEMLQRLRKMQEPFPRRDQPYRVGMISMYKQQAYAIERRVSGMRQSGAFEIEVGTVDSFQGREMDAVILTFSETNPKLRRFFYDRRRLNVALSRAKEYLIVIGSLDQLGSQSMAFGERNPIYELRLAIERAVTEHSASKENFNA
jgi:RecA/RadA recombinase